METMVITGGAGFIGSNFVRQAYKETASRLIVVDKLTYAGHLEINRVAFQGRLFEDADLILDAEREPAPAVLEAIRRHKEGIVALLEKSDLPVVRK